MTTTNKTNKEMTLKEVMAMTITLKTDGGEKVKSLVKFIPTDEKGNEVKFIDTKTDVDKDYSFPAIKAVGADGKDVIKDGKVVYHPVYNVCQLWFNFKKDKRNDTTTADKEVRKANNEKILAEAKGFKAVCRDLSAMADSMKGKGFLSMAGAMPCPVSINQNGATSGFWCFTSKELREKWLKALQIGIISGKYVTDDPEKPKKQSNKPLKTVVTLQKILTVQLGREVSYSEAYEIYKNTK